MFDTLILSAGYGTRLHPLTKLTPKPLLNISKEQTILSRLIHQFSSNMGDIFVNISYLAEAFIDESKLKFHNYVRFLYEIEVLGSHNTLYLTSMQSDKGLLVVHGDLVLSHSGVCSLIQTVKENPNQSLMVVHKRMQNSARSIVSIGEGNLITDFREVRVQLNSNQICYSNSGIYYFSRKDLVSLDLKFLRPLGLDLSSFVIPKLVSLQLLKSYFWEADRISIDSLQALNQASRILMNGGFK